ncbi:DUF2256 domain-containing protein [Pedobacter arcticus]|uniref:DUF2256 domain-containing protein n=1 Tax=Pedobacter arcticus TaxID=752140 RepID=UPI000368ABFC|nr:DUF2256 domain-containing protein [Pedobacter arcticus]
MKQQKHLITVQNKNGKPIAKNNLPTKICLSCKKAFGWRKKWKNCWNDVKYCSKHCQNIKY